MAKVHQRLASDLPYGAQVSIAIVADPYSEIGESIEVLRSTRDDILARLKAQKRPDGSDLIDDAQYFAGRRLEMLFERSTISPIKAIDPCKEAVDGGKFIDLLSDSQVKAFKEVRACHSHLGPVIFGLLFDILGRRQSITQSAVQRGHTTKHQIGLIGFQFRDALQQLAMFWGSGK